MIVELSTVVVVPETVRLPDTVTLPAAVKFAPLNVNAVVVPDLTINSPDEFVKLPKVVPSSFKNTSPPPASKVMSCTASNSIPPVPTISAIVGLVSCLLVKVSLPVSDTKLSPCNAVLNSPSVPDKVLLSKSIDLFSIIFELIFVWF